LVVDMSRRQKELSRQESLRLLGSVPFGRIVFTMHALPAIRPVNHVLHNGDVIIRTHHGASLLSAVGVVVAYEADAIDPAEHLGWSVIVTGIATSVGEPDRTRYERLLRPWANGHKDQIIRIEPELVTGFELVPGPLLVPHRPTDQP
jgi:hypothetical protein